MRFQSHTEYKIIETGKKRENKGESAIFQRSLLPTRFMLELQKLLIKYSNKGLRLSGFLPGIFSGGAKSIVMQISFVMLIFLLFSDHQSSIREFSLLHNLQFFAWLKIGCIFN